MAIANASTTPLASPAIGDKTVLANLFPGLTDEARVQAAIDYAAANDVDRVYVPANMLPYNATMITFDPNVVMIREGGRFDVYDVLAYGAAGDGITDDRVALQAAATAATGKTLLYPAGYTFRQAGVVTLGSGTTILGYGSSVQQVTDNTEIFNAEAKSDLTFRGLEFIGVGSDYSASDSSRAVGIFCGTSGSNIHVTQCTFLNFSYTSVKFRSNTNISFVGNTVIGPGEPTLTPFTDGPNYGVLVDAGCVRALVRGNWISQHAHGIIMQAVGGTIDDNTVYDLVGQHGVYAGYGASELVISDNNFNNMPLIGIKVQASNDDTDIDSITITGNVIVNVGGHGITVCSGMHPTGTKRCRTVSITGNTVRDAGEEGIAVDTTTAVTIVGNTIDTVGRHGISLSDVIEALIANNHIRKAARNGISESTVRNTDVFICNNQIIDCCTDGDSIEAIGIYRDKSASLRWTLDGNVIRDTQSKMLYGIFMADGDQTTDCVINNIVTGAVNAGARFESGGTAMKLYKGNAFSGTGGAVANDPPAQSVASAATITLPTGHDVVFITGTTNITAINVNGLSGARVTLKFAAGLTVSNTASIKLAGAANFVATADDTLTLICDGATWWEAGRSVN